MLDALVAQCAERKARRCGSRCATAMRARRRIYRRYGFAEVGVRKGYYPAPQGRREDAMVMSLDIAVRRGLVHALD